MNCPHCHCELEQEFYHKFISFRCPECGGHAMTIYALRNLSADRRFVDILWRTACYGYSEQGTVCGNCSQTMRKVTLPLNGIALELDTCPKCQMIWFDPAELERIPLPEAPENELPAAAKEQIALMQIRQEEKRISRIYRKEYRADHTPDEGWKYLVGLMGLPVELDAPEVRGLPWITWLLALVCIAVFAFTCPNLSAVIREWGFIPDDWTRKGFLTIPCSMFLHGSAAHLIGNVYFLLIFGDNVEDETGKAGYLLLILFSGLSALALHSVLDPRSAIPCIGASGFISGIITCYAVMFPKVRISFMLLRTVFLMRSGRNWFSIPAWAALLLWLVFQGFMAGISHRAGIGGGTAYLAHLGGALPGLAAALMLRCLRSQEKEKKKNVYRT